MSFRSAQMELKEMTAIVREQNALPRGRKRQDFAVGNGGIGISRLERCQNVVTEATQLGHNLYSDILVRIEARH